MIDFLKSLGIGVAFFGGLLLAYAIVLVIWARTTDVRSRIWRSWPRPVRKVLTVVGWVLLGLFIILIVTAQGADLRGVA